MGAGGRAERAAGLGGDVANTLGELTAITVLTPIKPGWMVWLRPAFYIGQNVPLVSKVLRQLSFIHFARWCVIERIPYNGPPQEKEDLHYRYLYFESNFNGTWDQYIDAFSHIIPQQMWVVWGSSFGFPGAVPVEPFKDYIRRNEYVANHYYCAYPDATTTMITSALELEQRFAEFKREAESLGPAAFATAYRDFLTDVQRHL